MCVFLRLLKHSANLAYQVKDLLPGKEEQDLEKNQGSEETTSVEQQSWQRGCHPQELVLESGAGSWGLDAAGPWGPLPQDYARAFSQATSTFFGLETAETLSTSVSPSASQL